MNLPRPALFLDRDGVINVDHGYVHRQEDFIFVEGIHELIRAANAHGYVTVVVTNQAGIARGIYTEQQFLELTKWMCEQLARENAHVDKVYYAPSHPTEGMGRYRREDFLRKPNPGMILQAKAELHLDVGNSVLVGDKYSDIEAGIAAGVGCNVLLGTRVKQMSFECCHASSLAEVMKLLSAPELRKK